MLSRRGFAGIGLAAVAGRMLPEAAYAQRAAIHGTLPPDMAWLNANENPDGPPQSSIEAMIKVLPEGGRYHYQEFRDIYATIARSEETRETTRVTSWRKLRTSGSRILAHGWPLAACSALLLTQRSTAPTHGSRGVTLDAPPRTHG